MKLTTVSFHDPIENLAFDEALLEEADHASEPFEVLRFWEQATYCVVLGRSSQRDVEVNLANTVQDLVPIYRRATGGASVVIGPGCLLFSLILSLDRRPDLRFVDQAHRYVMSRIRQTATRFHPDVSVDGICDLVLHGSKVSGNALRIKRRALLYHGTLLYNFDLSRIESYLRMPPKQPYYREGRKHRDFVANLSIDILEFQSQFARDWETCGDLDPLPQDRFYKLLNSRYRLASWHSGE